MKCSNCQSDNPNEARFCGECGAKLEIKCQSCGKENPPINKFCYECGHKLSESVKPAQVLNLDQPQSYIPKHLAEKILVGKASLEGERKQVTVLFADASGFTALSEKIDPEEVRSLMNNCLRLVIEDVHNYEGTINKFTGDGVMALFGAPIALEDHPYRAVSAALRIQESLKSFSEEIKRERGIDFKMRIGINTGLVVVGSIGNDLSMEYTAMGDTVNLASRLEGLAEPGTILISENTYRLVKDYFEFKPIGEIQVKGKSEPVKAYSAIGLTRIKGRFEISLERGLTKFVGREKELELIKDSLEKVKEGKGQIVCVIGEAGIGKSRLIHEFKSSIRDEEINYLEGHCISYGKSFSYLPIVEILKNNFTVDDRDDDELIKAKVETAINKMDSKLKDTIPIILDLLSVKTDFDILKDLDAGQKRQGIFEALKAITLRGSQIRPLVILIEDLHWIDKTSEDFINYLSGSVGNQRIMLLFTCRTGFVHSFIYNPYYTQIALTSLSTRECRVLIESTLLGENIPEDLMRLILERTGGNAFFVEEVTKSLLDTGIIIKSESGYMMNKNASQIDVPSTIQDVIMARIDRLEENRKRALQVGSVIGREFSYELLKKVSSLDDNELRDHLLTLINLELIYERGIFPDTNYVFKHALTHEVAYASLLVQKRKEIHERVGSAVEELYPNRLEEFYEVLAHHYNRADDKEKGLHYLTLAGKKAKEVVATEEALNYFREALKRLDEMPETETNEERKIDILFEMENIYDHIGKREEQKKILERIIDSSGVINDERRLSDGYIKQAEFLSVLEEYQKAQEVGESALTLKRKIGDKLGQGKALRGMGFINWRSGDYESALKYHQEALSVHRELGGGEAEGFELISLGEMHRKLGQYEDALSCLQEALRIYRELGISSGQHVSTFNIGSVYRDMGDYQACLEYYQECWRIIKARGYSSLSGVIAAASGLADIYLLLGNYQESLRYYSEALDIIRGLGDRSEEGNILSYMAAIYGILADYQQSVNHYKEALNIYRELGDKSSEGRVLTLIGNIYRQNLHDYNRAISFYKEGLEIKKEIEDISEIRSLSNSLGIACWNLGHYEEALAYYQDALEICKNTGNMLGEGITLSGMGVVYLSLCNYEEALKCNMDALNILKATGDLKVEGYILNSIGNVYYEIGDYQRAWKYYQESLKIRKELGDKKGEAWVLHNLGRVYRGLENYEEAKKCYKQALSLAEEVGEGELVANSKNALSEIKK